MRISLLPTLLALAAASATAAPLPTATTRLSTIKAATGDCPPGSVRDPAAVDDAKATYADPTALARAIEAIPCVTARTGTSEGGSSTSLSVKPVGVQPPGIKPGQLQPPGIKPVELQPPGSTPK